MSELKPLFVDLDDTYGADELGLPYRDIVGEGYVSGLAVSQRAAGINLSVDVAAGSCWVQGDTDTSAQPTYRCRNDAVVNLGITPDATNPRNVIIVAEVLDDTFDGGGSLLWRLRAVHGTPAGSPADPATPTSAILLARIAVTAADASIADAQITDLRAPANFGGGNIKLWAKGVDIASAATIAVTHPFHDVTGTVTITSITAQSAGFVVTLQFDGVLTFTDGSNLKIGGNFTTAAESTITLVCDGTNWYELSRSPISVTTEYDVLTKVTTAVTVVNTVTETNLVNYTVAASAMGSDKVLRLVAAGDFLQNSGGSTAMLRFKLGLGTTLIDTGAGPTTGLANSATRGAWRIEVEIANLTSSTQSITFNLDLYQPGGSNAASFVAFTTGQGAYGQGASSVIDAFAKAFGWNTGAKDTTGALALTLSVINQAVNASLDT